MNNKKQNTSVVISSSSKKLLNFVDGLRKHKLAQQEKLSKMTECTFTVNL
ncbi:MAG: hypothetical protein J6Q19_00365 [Bacteroidaceae bacterium]|jgi:hypothetical protein|nr:hypothetical protein [Bacteroidaceae bacterium]